MPVLSYLRGECRVWPSSLAHHESFFSLLLIKSWLRSGYYLDLSGIYIYRAVFIYIYIVYIYIFILSVMDCSIFAIGNLVNRIRNWTRPLVSCRPCAFLQVFAGLVPCEQFSEAPVSNVKIETRITMNLRLIKILYIYFINNMEWKNNKHESETGLCESFLIYVI